MFDGLATGRDGDDPLPDEEKNGGEDNGGDDSGNNGSPTPPAPAMLNRGLGNDRLESVDGAALLNGGDGNDFLFANQTGAEFRNTATVSINDFIDGFANTLNGGAGDDVLHLAILDQATGGTGADQFTVYSSGSNGAAAIVSEFNPAEDSLLIYAGNGANGLYPDDPSYDLVGNITSQTAGTDTLVLQDGVEIARLLNVTGLSIGLTRPDLDAAPVYTTLTGAPANAADLDVVVSVYPYVTS